VIQAMFSEKDQCHEMSHWARDIGHFRLSPILGTRVNVAVPTATHRLLGFGQAPTQPSFGFGVRVYLCSAGMQVMPKKEYL
jgi:hypothetical protein